MLKTLSKWRYQYFPDQVVGELLQKQWMENAVTALVLVATVALLNHSTAESNATEDSRRQNDDFHPAPGIGPGTTEASGVEYRRNRGEHPGYAVRRRHDTIDTQSKIVGGTAAAADRHHVPA